MYKIKQKDSPDIPVIQLTEKNYLRTKNYCPEVIFSATYSDKGFHIHFEVYEKNPKAEHKKNFEAVCEDSCVEWFVNFDPLHTEKYFNIEINANGCVDVSFRKNRYIKVDLLQEETKLLEIKTSIYDNHWTVDYIVPFELIKKYFVKYEFYSGQKFSANVYKCADALEVQHYACWKEVDLITEEFHCPERFGEMIVE